MIQRIHGVRGAQAYFYRGAEGSAIIDPGYTGSYRVVLRFLQAHHEDGKSLDWVILTHHHIDHAGTASPSRRRPGRGSPSTVRTPPISARDAPASG